ncbi:hypothetical protein NDU88_005804 [Pleurodeles waltl]|uniref:Uncharacterized protein n=1 Tax=Pleurodeles waltl TaxID=8319 RepID=A0AAV7W8V6_PLEWA|nr:hypothetical protein NDU88_005804 [Pleurodeles waltl]
MSANIPSQMYQALAFSSSCPYILNKGVLVTESCTLKELDVLILSLTLVPVSQSTCFLTGTSTASSTSVLEEQNDLTVMYISTLHAQHDIKPSMLTFALCGAWTLMSALTSTADVTLVTCLNVMGCLEGWCRTGDAVLDVELKVCTDVFDIDSKQTSIFFDFLPLNSNRNLTPWRSNEIFIVKAYMVKEYLW